MKKKKVASNPLQEIGAYMVSPVLSISPDASTQEAAQLMESKHVGCLLVKEGETFIGIITETDLIRNKDAMGAAPTQTPNPGVKVLGSPWH